MDNTFSGIGSYAAIAALVVAALAHFGIITDTNSVVSIIAGLVGLWGIGKQFFAHKALAQATGKI